MKTEDEVFVYVSSVWKLNSQRSSVPPSNHITDFASCFELWKRAARMIRGLTTKQLPFKSQNVPHLRYANIADEYKNNQQSILEATVSR